MNYPLRCLICLILTGVALAFENAGNGLVHAICFGVAGMSLYLFTVYFRKHLDHRSDIKARGGHNESV